MVAREWNYRDDFMSQKGALFALDFVIALTLVVFMIGSMYAFYYYKTEEVVFMKKQNELDQTMNIILNNIALGPASCDLITSNDVEIKKIGFCLDTTKDFNIKTNGTYKITCEGSPCFNLIALPNDVDYITKDIDVFVVNDVVKKKEYIDCIEGNDCKLDMQSVRVYVWE
jgi:hypothetical protein